MERPAPVFWISDSLDRNKENEMSPTLIAENLLDVGAEILRKRETKKVLDFLQGESQVLNFLYKHRNEGIYPKKISENLLVSPARIALLLNKLEHEGFIKRKQDIRDSRRTMIILTDDGIKELKRRKKESIECLSRLIEEVGEDSSSLFLYATQRIVE